MTTLKKVFRTYNKPSERVILLALCKRYDCTAEVNVNHDVVVGGEPNTVAELVNAYASITSLAYRKLAVAQISNKLAHVNSKTLTTEFMQAFAAVTCSFITGDAFMFETKTESHRAGLKAGSMLPSLGRPVTEVK